MLHAVLPQAVSQSKDTMTIMKMHVPERCTDYFRKDGRINNGLCDLAGLILAVVVSTSLAKLPTK
eukprot:3435127-Amphidinium_carterae.4